MQYSLRGFQSYAGDDPQLQLRRILIDVQAIIEKSGISFIGSVILNVAE